MSKFNPRNVERFFLTLSCLVTNYIKELYA